MLPLQFVRNVDTPNGFCSAAERIVEFNIPVQLRLVSDTQTGRGVCALKESRTRSEVEAFDHTASAGQRTVRNGVD